MWLNWLVVSFRIVNAVWYWLTYTPLDAIQWHHYTVRCWAASLQRWANGSTSQRLCKDHWASAKSSIPLLPHSTDGYEPRVTTAENKKKLLKFAYRTDEALSNMIYVLCDGSTWLWYIENKFKGAALLCSEAFLAITAPSPLMLTANTGKQSRWIICFPACLLAIG